MRGQLAEIKAAGAATEKQIELATSARLHIEGVRVADFSSGLEPVFFVKIVSSQRSTGFLQARSNSF